MDAGLKEAIAIAIAAPNAKRPLAFERLIDEARRCQNLARHSQANPSLAGKMMKYAQKVGRRAADFLPPGGELRERLLSNELISEEEWHRMVGPPLPPPVVSSAH